MRPRDLLYGSICYRCGQVWPADAHPGKHYNQAGERCYDLGGERSGPIPFGPCADTVWGTDIVKSMVEFDVSQGEGYTRLPRVAYTSAVDEARRMVADAMRHPAPT